MLDSQGKANERRRVHWMIVGRQLASWCWARNWLDRFAFTFMQRRRQPLTWATYLPTCCLLVLVVIGIAKATLFSQLSQRQSLKTTAAAAAAAIDSISVSRVGCMMSGISVCEQRVCLSYSWLWYFIDRSHHSNRPSSQLSILSKEHPNQERSNMNPTTIGEQHYRE